MSVKLPKRLRSKKQKYPQDNVLGGVLHKLGLDHCLTAPLDTASMLDIITWPLEKQTPVDPKDLPKSFLQRLWLFCHDARHTCCQTSHPGEYTSNNFEEANQFAINPLDLVTAVFLSANTFLQYEMAAHMMQCHFAIPLILPSIRTEEPGLFLTWPLRGIISQWWENSSDDKIIQDGNLASTAMPLVSCVKLGNCSISKSHVLNHIVGGVKSTAFLYKGMSGGQLPKRLCNGLVEIAWYLPTGDPATDNFPVPVVFSNLRGDASSHQRCLHLLCKASSVVVFFCGDLREKDKQIIQFYKDMASVLILVDLSGQERNEERGAGFAAHKLEDNALPEECVLSGKGFTEKELADQLNARLKGLLPHKVKLVTLEDAANLAAEIGLNVDEGLAFKKAMVTVDEVLKGLDEGSAEFKQKQLPLQGPLWQRLSQIEKEESKQRKEVNETDSKLQREKKGLLAEVSNYKMTRSMKVFTEALFTADHTERMYFLSWFKLRLQITQTKKTEQIDRDVDTQDDQMSNSDSFCTDSTFEEDTVLLISEEVHEEGQESQHFKEPAEEPTSQHINVESVGGPVIVQELQMLLNESREAVPQDGFKSDLSHQTECETFPFESETNTSLCKNEQPNQSEFRPEFTSSATELQVEKSHPPCFKPFEQDPSILGLEHFLREMGLIFELTHISPGSGNHNVLRLPSLAADLLIYGIPLELMDGDASNIPTRWLSCVFAELLRRLPQEKCRTRILTSLGLYDAKNKEVLLALFNVKFHEGRNRSTKGIYMAVLCLPDHLKKDLECDLLLFIDVEGLCSVSPDGNTKMAVSDHEMATVAMSLGDILLLNISSYSSCELEATLAFFVSALLRVREFGSVPPCQFLLQDVGINSILQASQLRRVSEMLRSETDCSGIRNVQTNELTYIRGPWLDEYSSQPVDSHYSDAMLHFKKNLFEVLKKNAAVSEASNLTDFMKHVCAILEAVKSDSFSIHLKNSDITFELSLLCTNICRWNKSFLEDMENWIVEQTKKILETKVKVFDSVIQKNLLRDLKNEATEEVKTGSANIMTNIEGHLMENESLKLIAKTIQPILMSNLSKLQEKVRHDVINKLDRVSEDHFISTLLKNFQTLLKKEQESVLLTLTEKSRSTDILLEDKDLEEDFELVWNKTYSMFDFKPSDTDDIPTRVRVLLKENLKSRGLQKHLKKLEVNGQSTATNGFQVFEEHYGYLNRLKYKFADNNQQQMLKAQRVAGNIIKDYNQFVAEKYEVVADFSDRYITELLENIEKALKENTMETRTAFEVDLKVYLCNCAGQDFQKLHNHFAKEKELLMCINKTKNKESAEFIYNFRKRDQGSRLAHRFTSMVFKPTVLHYMNGTLGQIITEEILAENQEFESPRTFHKYLLENLVKEDSFESYLEYLLHYDNLKKRKIQDTVQAHLSQSTSIKNLHQERLGEIVSKIAAAVGQTNDSTPGVLINAQQLLEKVCDILAREEGVHVNREHLIGPLFGFTTEWEHFTKCLLDCLTTMKTHLVQEMSQDVNIDQILESLAVQSQNCLEDRVQGCDQRCPACNAPCDVRSQHEVHEALLHRPVGLQAYVSCSPSSDKYYKSTNQVNEIKDKDMQMSFIACKDICHLDPDWNISINNQLSSDYWRYMCGRFTEQLAEHFKQEPLNIPAEWRMITKEIALQSLK